jgi:RNA methyltransferase, TrmH family
MARSGTLLDGREILLETPNLIEDAIQSGVNINTVLVRSDAPPSLRKLLQHVPGGARRIEVEAKIFPELASTESSPGILALASAPDWKEQDLFPAGQPLLVVVLAGIQDPGNLGTILRVAEAFGASGVLAMKGTVSPFNAKAIRSSAGTLFRLPMVVDLTAPRIVSLLQRENVALLASAPRGGSSLSEIDVSKPLALALGSEGAGLPRELEAAGVQISIPIAPRVESLNVATAASVLLYEIARRRLTSTSTQRED